MGSSFVRIMNRVGSRPVHGSRYLRSIVIVSSPEIESSRSTATMLVGRERRAARRRSSPAASRSAAAARSSVVSPASVGAAVLWAPSRPVRTRAIVPLPDRFGPTSMNIFCRSVPLDEDVAEQLGERVDRLARRRPTARPGT